MRGNTLSQRPLSFFSEPFQARTNDCLVVTSRFSSRTYTDICTTQLRT